ncbi:MORC family CW-type zinc finger protein 3-like isoform X3 [Mangifera indica]|uniref:MORC family CW-type zinc finger protein 3-like isoform X3 n=1 Tax=Mangifera indica TaxID=29780 RepID=UPI001CFA7D53|nr:MORC family CW-type zinc finger protein 3-like isoform X3 [Mangifera indica]
MGDQNPKIDAYTPFIMLSKDDKPICRAQCLNPPGKLPGRWRLQKIVPKTELQFLDHLSYLFLCPAPECSRDQKEWVRFLKYLQKNNMVAIAKLEFWTFYILPPNEDSHTSHVRVAYQMEKICHNSNVQRHKQSVVDIMIDTGEAGIVQPLANKTFITGSLGSPDQMVKESTCRKEASIPMRASEDNFTFDLKLSPAVGDHLACESSIETCSRTKPSVLKKDGLLEKNYVKTDPSYLQTLGQAHSGWIFGAIAELVDNSMDAKSSKLEISIEVIFFKQAGRNIPMLSVIDDGHGMTHQDVVRMTYFGHKQPNADDPGCIGRFGVGFKTGAMRLGRDALVLTQTAESRSIAFLSQSLNQGKDNLEIPIVSYYRKGQFMELDTSVQSEATAKYNLKAIKEFSPFNKYLIGEKAGFFRDKQTGTQIYIWNLDEWGSNYCLEWQNGLNGGSSFHQGDIYIRSRRIRSRPGQISQKAYKRVGSMIHNGDVGRGVIGVIDVTDLMDDGNGRVWVHNNKQGFQDCEPYARLEEWLGKVADEYWDTYFDSLQLGKGTVVCKPDQEWVQCNKCRKWRMLDSDFNTKSLPLDWFCYMEPFNGKCETPEAKVDRGVITVSTKRSGYDELKDDKYVKMEGKDEKEKEEEAEKRPLKRIKKGLPRACKKV